MFFSGIYFLIFYVIIATSKELFVVKRAFDLKKHLFGFKKLFVVRRAVCR